MAKWCVEDLIQEIDDLDKLAIARNGSQIIPRMVDQVKEKINAVNEISAGQLLAVTKVLAESSLNDSTKDILQNALDERSLASSSQCLLKVVTKAQTLGQVWNYLTTSEYSALVKAPLPTMVQILCGRLRKVGVKSMKEKTKKPTIAFLIHILVSRGEPAPLGPDVYKLSQYFTDAFTSHLQQPLVQGVATYPNTPEELGQVSCKKLFQTVFFPHLSGEGC